MRFPAISEISCAFKRLEHASIARDITINSILIFMGVVFLLVKIGFLDSMALYLSCIQVAFLTFFLLLWS